MPIEAYALVVMKRSKEWKFIPGDYGEQQPQFQRIDEKISFCRIRLVDGRGKVPRWEVVEELVSDYKPGDIADWCVSHEIKLYEDLTRVCNIDDRRVTLKQIQQLFPETKSMPFKIACDFVRDRI